MNICSRCRMKIDDDDKKFCPNCGTPVAASRVHYTPVREEAVSVVADECTYSMGWHNFFSNIGVILLAAVYVYIAFKFFAGEILGFLLNNDELFSGVSTIGNFGVLAVLTPIFGGYMVVAAISCVVTGFRLRGFRETAPSAAKSATTTGIIVPGIYFVVFILMVCSEAEEFDLVMSSLFRYYKLICPVTIYFFGLILLSVVNKKYYYNRRKMFY